VRVLHPIGIYALIRDALPILKTTRTISMTAKQLQRLLDNAELSQRGTARELEINERTMRRYVSGDQPIPRVVEFAVLHLIDMKGKKQ
jgi:hypothetical protein